MAIYSVCERKSPLRLTGRVFGVSDIDLSEREPQAQPKPSLTLKAQHTWRSWTGAGDIAWEGQGVLRPALTVQMRYSPWI